MGYNVFEQETDEMQREADVPLSYPGTERTDLLVITVLYLSAGC